MTFHRKGPAIGFRMLGWFGLIRGIPQENRKIQLLMKIERESLT